MISELILALVLATITPIDIEIDYPDHNITYEWQGEVLTKQNGVVVGPSGKETYYNLPMDGVVRNMRNAGYGEDEYPYWIREDGVKMLGDYVIVATDFSVRPQGTVLPTTLGMGISCDTGTFIYTDPYQLDVAVAW